MKGLGWQTKELVFSSEHQGELLGDSGMIRCIFLEDHFTHRLEHGLKEAGQGGGRLTVKR